STRLAQLHLLQRLFQSSVHASDGRSRAWPARARKSPPGPPEPEPGFGLIGRAWLSNSQARSGLGRSGQLIKYIGGACSKLMARTRPARAARFWPGLCSLIDGFKSDSKTISGYIRDF